MSPPVVDLNERRAAPRLPEPARVERVIQDLARELSAQAEPIGATVARRLLLAEDRLVDHDDPALASLATRFAHATVGATLAALAYGMPTETARPTQSSLELFEHLTERDDGLAVLLRSHRLVSAELWQAWATFTDEEVLDRRLHRAVLALSTRELGAYSDSVCEHLTGAWPEARRRRRRGVGVPVAQLLRRAVFGAPDDADAALAELGYPVDACHVAVALPACVGREQLEDVARRLQLACGAPALAAPDPDGMTIWVAFGRAAAAQDLERAPVLRDLEASGRARRRRGRGSTASAAPASSRRTRCGSRCATTKPGSPATGTSRCSPCCAPTRRAPVSSRAWSSARWPATMRSRFACATRSGPTSRWARARSRPRRSCSCTRRRSSTG